jgi:hypothetical protein
LFRCQHCTLLSVALSRWGWVLSPPSVLFGTLGFWRRGVQYCAFACARVRAWRRRLAFSRYSIVLFSPLLSHFPIFLSFFSYRFLPLWAIGICFEPFQPFTPTHWGYWRRICCSVLLASWHCRLTHLTSTSTDNVVRDGGAEERGARRDTWRKREVLWWSSVAQEFIWCKLEVIEGGRDMVALTLSLSHSLTLYLFCSIFSFQSTLLFRSQWIISLGFVHSPFHYENHHVQWIWIDGVGGWA